MINIVFLDKLDAMENDAEFALPSEHYDNIHEGSIISIMIENNRYIEKGALFEKSPAYWAHWVVQNDRTAPPEPERAYITVIDPGRPARRGRPAQRRRRKSFAAALHRHHNAPGYVNPTSQCFISDGLNFYHAPLSLESPRRDRCPSLVFVRAESEPNDYQVFVGRLSPWVPPIQYHN